MRFTSCRNLPERSRQQNKSDRRKIEIALRERLFSQTGKIHHREQGRQDEYQAEGNQWSTFPQYENGGNHRGDGDERDHDGSVDGASRFKVMEKAEVDRQDQLKEILTHQNDCAINILSYRQCEVIALRRRESAQRLHPQ